MVGTRSGHGVSDGEPPLDRGYYEDDAPARSNSSEAEAASSSNPRRPLNQCRPEDDSTPPINEGEDHLEPRVSANSQQLDVAKTRPQIVDHRLEELEAQAQQLEEQLRRRDEQEERERRLAAVEERIRLLHEALGERFDDGITVGMSARSMGGSSQATPEESSKRGASDDFEMPIRKATSHTRLRPKAPTPYKGKHLKEHKNFMRECALLFRNAPAAYSSDSEKILAVAPYLEGDPADAWEVEEARTGPGCHTWEAFLEFLLDRIADPVNRQYTVGQEYEDARQTEKQRVYDFVTYLERLEAQLPEYSEEHKARTLLSKLRPELRRRVTDGPYIPGTRMELARLASRLEDNAKQAVKVDPDEGLGSSRHSDAYRSHERKGRRQKSLGQKPDSGPQEPRHGGEPGGKSNDRSGRGRGPVNPSVVCFNCDKKGHYASSCTAPRKAAAGRFSAVEASERKAASAPSKNG